MIFDFEYSPEPKFQHTFETHMQSLAVSTFYLFHRLARTHLLPYSRIAGERAAYIAASLVDSGHVGMNDIGYYLIIPCPPHPPSPLAFDLNALATLNAPIRAATIGDVDLLRSLTKDKRTRTELRSRFSTSERYLDAVALAQARGEMRFSEKQGRDFIWAAPGEKLKPEPKARSKTKPKAKPKADRYAAVTPPWHAGLDLPKRKKPPKRRSR